MDQTAPQPGLDGLEELVERIRQAGLPVDLKVEGEARRLGPGVELALYRIVQEALTNTMKHAGPAQACVAVRYLGDIVEVEVADNGSGAAANANFGGHGLIGMRQRVALYGGSLDAGTAEGSGYRVRARLPLNESRT